MMDAVRKFVAERRDHFRSTAMWHEGDDDDADDIFCYHQQNEDGQGRWSTKDSWGVTEAGATPSFGFQRRPPAALITSSEFDSDQRFVTIARTLFQRLEAENMSEREAIEATLRTADRQRSFLESIDTRYAGTSFEVDQPLKQHAPSDEIAETLLRTRSVFYSTLQAMWREAAEGNASSSYLNGSSLVAALAECDVAPQGDCYESELRTAPPKTPKHYSISSPIESTTRATSLFHPSDGNPLHQPLNQQARKRRKWFFEDPSERVRKSIGDAMATASSSSSGGNAFPSLKGGASRFHFDFKLPVPSSSSSSATPVQTLRLDGGCASSSSVVGRPSMYRPPTSPMCRVSMDRIEA
jgi:hypothetical protein